jgi:NAD(P)-dependent dehydrogenase (short-subunit alcohol dehydrogenase family)
LQYYFSDSMNKIDRMNVRCVWSDPVNPVKKEEEYMKSVLITGANRGIGLEFARQYAERSWRVWATCRNPEKAEELRVLGGDVRVCKLDVTDEARMQTLAAEIDSLDLLIHNAGIFAEGEAGLDSVDAEKMLNVFRVNMLAPVLLTKHLQGKLNSGGCVAALTSGAGVLWDEAREPGGQYSYGASKAALARALRALADDLRPRNITVAGLNPGYVRTDMTGGADSPAPLSPEESVAGMIAVLDRITLEQSGRFFNYDGAEAPWLRQR